MIARGDLGVEIGDAEVPAIQESIIQKARSLDKPVITATQMMESMIQSPVPTRAEVSDVANAVVDVPHPHRHPHLRTEPSCGIAWENDLVSKCVSGVFRCDPVLA